ncbi:chemotaxis protein CheA [Rhodocyclaceae bacterium SMB388]
MNDSGGMDDLLQDFLTEAGDMLSVVDNKLVDLERSPDDKSLLNEIFRGFHTIKGGAAFLNAAELVTLCHLTEDLFDKLRDGEMVLTSELMDVIMAATAAMRDMFDLLERGAQPRAAEPALIARLKQAIQGEPMADRPGRRDDASSAASVVDSASGPADGAPSDGPDWVRLHQAVTGAGHPPGKAAPHTETKVQARKTPEQIIERALGRRASDRPGAISVPVGRREGERQRDTSIRVDTARLDQVLYLTGEIGLIRNRLDAMRRDILGGRNDSETLHALDLAVTRLDLLVSDLRNAVMKTRMQPIGWLFQKYPRIARDLARNLGKDVELVLKGEDIEIDKTMIENLGDPIIHLIRNAVDHGIEDPADRIAGGKRATSVIRLEAQQDGDHIVIAVADDGRGMNAERLRAKALEKGLISDEAADAMDERQSYNLVFLPGLSTAQQVSDVSGRGVGMDVVRTNIRKLNGTIEIRSRPDKGTTFVIRLPLTLAPVPVNSTSAA